MSVATKITPMSLSPTARNARIETATETLAGYIGYLSTQIRIEKQETDPNAGRIAALERQVGMLLDERKAFHPDDEEMIAGPSMFTPRFSRRCSRGPHERYEISARSRRT